MVTIRCFSTAGLLRQNQQLDGSIGSRPFCRRLRRGAGKSSIGARLGGMTFAGRSCHSGAGVV